MSDVKVTCGECDGAGYTEEIRHPAGGYSEQTEPDYREVNCDTCGGDGKEEITRAELLERNIAAHERKVKPVRDALDREWKRRRLEVTLAYANRIAELV